MFVDMFILQVPPCFFFFMNGEIFFVFVIKHLYVFYVRLMLVVLCLIMVRINFTLSLETKILITVTTHANASLFQRVQTGLQCRKNTPTRCLFLTSCSLSQCLHIAIAQQHAFHQGINLSFRFFFPFFCALKKGRSDKCHFHDFTLAILLQITILNPNIAMFYLALASKLGGAYQGRGLS